MLRPNRASTFVASENIIAGNVIGYGATGGEIFIAGQVGERFCVRNSGATAVVEGLGDHGCEYMTGGVAVVLGRTGRNVAAGMSGGIAYLLDLDESLLNTEMVDAIEPGEADLELLQGLVKRHLEETGSVVAEGLLDDWAFAVDALHQGAAARVRQGRRRPRGGRVGRPRRGRDDAADDGGGEADDRLALVLCWGPRRSRATRRSSQPSALRRLRAPARPVHAQTGGCPGRLLSRRGPAPLQQSRKVSHG